MTTVSIDTPTQNGSVQVNVHLVATLKVSPIEARRKVNRDVVTELGTGLAARDPELAVTADRLVWRVPIVLSLPFLGDLGQVGLVSVDTDTGEVLTNPEDIQKILRFATMLHAGATLSAN